MTAHPTTALLLAGGLGTRLRPVTDGTPKCLVDIAGRPLLDYWVEQLESLRVQRALLNTHHLPALVRGYIADSNARRRVQIIESHEPALLGSAGTIAANPGWCDGFADCLVIYADNLSDALLADMLVYHRSHPDPVTMLLFHAPEPARCGIAECDTGMRIIGFEEKPANPKSELANGGVYILDGDAYREIAAMNAFDLGFDVIPRFIGRMRGWAWRGYHRDIGTLDSLAAARREAPGVFGHA